MHLTFAVREEPCTFSLTKAGQDDPQDPIKHLNRHGPTNSHYCGSVAQANSKSVWLGDPWLPRIQDDDNLAQSRSIRLDVTGK
jgi:hypothetical protein